ncbi:putative AAD14-putative aryl-alcohol reductase [Violaceomyces palustris]|uniref:AAD14-putative aryl-alcohol reductase n=1 Tax=Violaceomyces palustris TaxID=1673888 RepID=A0ACD0NMV3_9BASI|nr:putative AAD14-putative aryl-alcohol reductase [Violaceomyces palustris]
MSLGDAWKDSPLMSGGIGKDESIALLDHFYKRGGNFIDTANNYTNEQSEKIIGEWMESRGIRDQIVLATKFTTCFRDQELGSYISTNNCGNSSKSLHVSLHESLKKLRTDYIDLLYVHWWDYSTSIEELMISLNKYVQQGKIIYLGASDMPAWVVSSANAYARAHGLTPFSVYQGRWSANERDFEREIIPMARHEGMALAPWGALGQGRFRSQAQIQEREKERGPIRGGRPQSEDEKNISRVLEKIGNELGGASITQVALAYVFAKYPYVYPIVGGTKISYLDDNIEALDLNLSDEQVKEIEASTPFNVGFPHSMIGQDHHITGETTFPLLAHSGKIDWVKHPRGPRTQ